MYAGVDKNKYGDYDMHFDKDKDSESSEVESSEKDEIERILEDNPEVIGTEQHAPLLN